MEESEKRKSGEKRGVQSPKSPLIKYISDLPDIVTKTVLNSGNMSMTVFIRFFFFFSERGIIEQRLYDVRRFQTHDEGVQR